MKLQPTLRTLLPRPLFRMRRRNANLKRQAREERERGCVMNDGLVLEKRAIMLRRRRDCLASTHPARRRHRLSLSLSPSPSLPLSLFPLSLSLSLISKGAIVLAVITAPPPPPPSVMEQEELCATMTQGECEAVNAPLLLHAAQFRTHGIAVLPRRKGPICKRTALGANVPLMS